MRIIRGRKALVTGAAAGIGRALALALAREGADLFLVDIDADKLEAAALQARALGVTAIAESAISPSRQEISAIERLTAEWGALNILINNAGVTWYGPTDAMSAEQWRRIMAVNLLAPMQLFRELLPLLAAADEAHVLNVCSMFGVAPWRKAAAYQTSKYGLVGFTAALRAEFQREHFGITALCPGFVDTALLDGKANDRAAPAWISTTPEIVARQDHHGDPPQSRTGAGDARHARLLAALTVAPGLVDWLLREGWRRRKRRSVELLRRPRHHDRRTHRRDAAPDILFVLLETPGLAVGGQHDDLPAIEAPRHGCKARDHLVAAGLHREHEAVRVARRVAEGHLADHARGAAGELPLAEQVVGDPLLVDRRERLQEVVRMARRRSRTCRPRPRSARAAPTLESTRRAHRHGHARPRLRAGPETRSRRPLASVTARPGGPGRA